MSQMLRCVGAFHLYNALCIWSLNRYKKMSWCATKLINFFKRTTKTGKDFPSEKKNPEQINNRLKEKI